MCFEAILNMQMEGIKKDGSSRGNILGYLYINYVITNYAAFLASLKNMIDV